MKTQADAYKKWRENLMPGDEVQYMPGGDEKNIPRVNGWKRPDGSYVEVIKNPSRREKAEIAKTQEYGNDIGLIVTESNVYAFRRDKDFHARVARKLGLKEYVSALMDLDGNVLITDATTAPFKRSPLARKVLEDRLGAENIKSLKMNWRESVSDWEIGGKNTCRVEMFTLDRWR